MSGHAGLEATLRLIRGSALEIFRKFRALANVLFRVGSSDKIKTGMRYSHVTIKFYKSLPKNCTEKGLNWSILRYEPET